ncbi:hypothetical protein RvY_16466 [Ramazzottius varieornatus]|uniref:Peptidase S1 domain-containing protein n=1 Tax=Ramazzottius varieornatus TaxID=947166 RepID=A0A1D1W645_RAMVA|nr:hypothetical protein RvY_16466 [Ramazzottius varieornatus]
MKSATGVVSYLSFAVLQLTIAALGSNSSLDVNSEDVLERPSNNNSAAEKRTFDIVHFLSPPSSPSNGSPSPQAILDTIDKFWHDFFQTIIGAAGGQIGAGTELLQQTAIEIFSVADCRAGLKGLAFTDKMVCSGFDGGKYDSCQDIINGARFAQSVVYVLGDSGGPMVCDAGNAVWTLNGIVSFGIGCARAGNPEVYSDVHAFVPWINQTIAKN